MPRFCNSTPSTQLARHERGFSGQNQLSIQSVIDKKKFIELQETSKSVNQRNSIDDLFIEKKGPHLTKQLSKELEI